LASGCKNAVVGVMAIYQQQIEEQKDTCTPVTSCVPPEKRVAGAESPVFRRPNHG
jgi:hypothetical protein